MLPAPARPRKRRCTSSAIRIPSPLYSPSRKNVTKFRSTFVPSLHPRLADFPIKTHTTTLQPLTTTPLRTIAMFKELEPILEKRALTVTIARLPKSNLICVTVVPTQIDGDKNIDKAILEPLKLDPATAEDLDAGLAEALASHATTFLSMQESGDQAKAAMEAALQAAKDEAKKKADETKK